MAELDIWSAVRREDESQIRLLSQNGIRVEAPTPSMKRELQELADAAGERIVGLLRASPISNSGRRGFNISEDCAVLEIFYGTDRPPDGNRAPYGAGPERGELRTGTATAVGPVVFPDSSAETVSCEDFQHRDTCYGDVAKRYCLIWGGELEAGEFFDRVNRKHAAAFIFVHGYRTQIDEAAQSVHKIYQGLGTSLAPVLFSWPTMETALGSMLGYPGDRDTALVSSGALKKLIASMAQKGQVSVVGHSMGTLVVVEALKELAAGKNSEGVRLGEVILIAADISNDELLARTLPDFRPLVARVSVYSSQNDCVLVVAKGVMHKPRVGLIPPQASHPEIDSIDVSDVNNDIPGWGHSYHLVSPEIASDLGDVLQGEDLASRANVLVGLADGNRVLVYKREGGPYPEAGLLQDYCVGRG